LRQEALTSTQAAAFSRAYAGQPDQVQCVRADLRPLLDGCPVTDDVILCVSELAANAALHSHSGRFGAQFTVRAEIHDGDYAWIQVEDNGGTWTDPVPDPSRGHGLDIIRALAADWGIDGDSRTRTVWARIDWPKRALQPFDSVAETEAVPR
jgi:two-component sensor histidine kinase